MFGLQSAVGYLEERLFSNYFIGIDNAFRFEIVKASDIPGGLEMLYAGSSLWPLVFEAGIAVLLIYVMTKLIQKKQRFNDNRNGKESRADNSSALLSAY